ncbi:hypothetical protein [Nocardia tengchongensis]|uniref:hypothetical protein n=1 Tax=Nocardia tengchongensis TaxID=2055889 RepID=UPI0036C1179D
MTTANPETSTATTEPDTGTVAPATGFDWVTVVPVPLSPEKAEAIRAQFAADPTAYIPIKVHPMHVLIGANPRELANALESLDDKYVESVKAGYKQLPSAFLRNDGVIQVKDGQRRILGARKGEMTSVPVVLEKAPEGTEAQQLAAVLVDQVTANVERVELTAAEIFGAQATLVGLDLPAREKRERLRALGITDRKQADALRTLAATDGKARSKAMAGQMDLLHAADAAEFDDDPDAFNELRYASNRGNAQFVAKLQELREDRRIKAARAVEAARYEQRGFRILERYPNVNQQTKELVPAEDLRTAEGNTPVSADIAPSQWAVYLSHRDATVLAESGEEINADLIDPDTEDNPEHEAREGYYHASKVRTEDRFTHRLFCLDYRRAGFTRVKPGQTSKKPGGITGTQVGVLNKQASNDTVARRTFAAGWLTKTPKEMKPQEKKQAAALLFAVRKWRASLESALPAIFDDRGARAIAAELLGIPVSKINDGSAVAKMTRPDQLDKYEIGLAIGAIERCLHRDTTQPRTASYWRCAQKGDVRAFAVSETISHPYLKLLASLGHELRLMERVTLGDVSPEDALTEIAAKKATAAASGSHDDRDDAAAA